VKSIIPVALIFLLLVLGCGRLKDNISRNSSSFDPYKGSLSDLLRPEISNLSIKFKLVGTRDMLSQHPGASEAKAFTYTQEAAGVSVQVDGVLVNFTSSQQAEKRLKEIAADVTASVVSKGKWQRFSTKDGGTVGWTNGSVMCLVKSQFAKPAGNFEESAPF
jgi:hypothetical protein